MRQIFTFVLIILSISTYTQTAYEHIRNTAVYEFLDELLALGLADLNTAVKPYSRMQIANALLEAEAQKSELSPRQQKELEMYLNYYALDLGREGEYRLNFFKDNPVVSTAIDPPGLHYRDSFLTFSLSPVWGRTYFHSHDTNAYHNYGGATAFAYMGKNWAIYAGLRDNYQKNVVLAKPTYLTTALGGNYKLNEGGRIGGDFSEMTGGIMYSWKWGSAGLLKDHLQWGDGYRCPAIFSGRTPSFAMIKLNMHPAKWLDFNYFHGWLVSEEIDSNGTYITSQGDLRTVFRQKYIAANMFTVKPWKGINFSFGNSIVYSDMPVHLAYLIPVMFYKSIDHTVNHNVDNQNSQMYVGMSIRRIKHLHLYATYFVDEFSIKRIRDPKRRNFTSGNVGMRLSNWPLKDVILTGEYYMSNPMTYKHRVPATTFESNRFNLGHYLVDNSREYYAALEWRPMRRLSVKAEYVKAEKGNDYPYDFRFPGRVDEHPLLQDIIWSSTEAGLGLSWTLMHHTHLRFGYRFIYTRAQAADGFTAEQYLNRYTPALFHGKNHVWTGGFTMGF